MKKLLFTTLALLISPFFLAPAVLAQSLPCGNIIDEYGDSEAIQDCADPFKITTDPTNSYNLLVDGTAYNKNGDIVPVAEGGTSRIHVEGFPIQTNFRWALYKHDGNDYRYVDLEEKFPTSEYFYEYVQTYFTNDTDRAFYLNIIELDQNGEDYSQYLYNEDGSERIDATTGETVSTRLQGFYLSADYDFDGSPDRAGRGTYTMLITEYSIYPTSNSLWDKIRHHIIPTAHAQFLEDYRYTLTFTIVEAGDEPDGASSVLFLPGIQASRLYLGDGNQIYNRLWEPTNNTDISALGLSNTGTSIVDIRTNDVIDETSVDILGKNIYKSFMSFLDDLVSNHTINDWTPFAYDWRYDVFDVAENGTKYLDGTTRSPVDEAIKLASSSLSKKVTIIAHSNGGLLAKAVMYELEKRGKENIVDKIVFIGTPQLGTPKAIGTILHGYDQQALGGLIIDDGIAREVIKNLPGAYSLLPSEKYFEVSNEPVIYFDNSSTTAALRTGYGSSVNTIGTLNAFMTGLNDNTGRSSVAQSEVNKPTLANSVLYFEALEKHKLLLDSWVAPNEVKVFQIAGTGLPTVRAVEYREVIERICPVNAVSVLLCPKIAILKPHIRFTPYGDETVVSDSAIYSPDNSVQKYFFDLDKVENERIPIIGTKISHENLTETSQIKDFVEQVITNGSISDVEFMTPDQSNFSQIFDIEEMNSPVQISAKDEQGRVTGMVKEGNEWVRKEDIPGSLYIEFGGTKYLIIPSDVKRTTTLVGEAYGGYTLTLSTLDGNGVQTKRHEVVDATTTPNMIATYSKGTSTYSTIKTDYTGDGIQDYENTVDGVYIAPPVPVYSYTLLKNNISTLPLNKTLRNVLLSLAVEAEKFSLKANQKLYDPLEKLTLRALEATIQLYLRQGLISKVQADGLILIVKFLVK